MRSTSCASMTFSPTGRRYPVRPQHCAFQMFSAPPADGYEPVGTIDFRTSRPGNVGDLRGVIGPLVCQAGGDAAFASPNEAGFYVNATVLKRVQGPSALAAPDHPQDTAGCQYDTQCKGERVCVNHQCTEPVK